MQEIAGGLWIEGLMGPTSLRETRNERESRDDGNINTRRESVRRGREAL